MAYAALFTLGIIWFAYLIWGIIPKEERARSEVHETKAELASLEERERTLRANLHDLDTPRGKETVMRDTKGVALPGEEVIVVVEQEPVAAPMQPLPWWRKVLRWFH